MRAAGGVQDENQHSWLMKLVFRWEDRQLLGVHIVGDIAGELIHLAVAYRRWRTIDRFINRPFAVSTRS